ncbi:hypothetical protein SAMN05421595_0870 [Austwickia chelonae]|uniref:Cytoplasmic protein n=2 Tax=Austwickia TaxID=1184606 RepID=K6V7Z8_9MICO|nr:hypothetical protein AUCHE_08_06000 [Austwickia chelonae NBRC 105200]SEW01880.1 hypothetical protein SAMN05421595_0870 [Austwickia chelonae]
MTAAEGLRELSLVEARRMALDAQGFGARHRPRGAVRRQHVRAVAERVQIVQLDSVTALTRSHYLPFYSRLGPYDPAWVDELRDGDPLGRRHLVEYWAHEASLISPELWPLFGFRMRRAWTESWSGMRRVAREHPELVELVYREVARHPGMTSREVEAAVAHEEVKSAEKDWGWNWSLVKSALEHLFWAGRVTSSGRNRQFERQYSVVEAVLPEAVRRQGPMGDDPLPEDEAVRALVELAARAHGVGTESCLRDYARLSCAQARPAIRRLCDEGVLLPARVEGWRKPAFVHREARLPGRPVRARALLSPFDSLIWQRDRVRALFGFDYRLEFYIPAPQRVYGYYVMPFLWGDDLVARVDLRADRRAGILRVSSVYWEPGRYQEGGAAMGALAAELSSLALFLGLDRVQTGRTVVR